MTAASLLIFLFFPVAKSFAAFLTLLGIRVHLFFAIIIPPHLLIFQKKVDRVSAITPFFI